MLKDKDKSKSARQLGNAERDIVALGIATAALILFVGTAGSLMPMILKSWFRGGEAPDILLINAVLLNIALVVFGWRRYRDLQIEIRERRQAENRARELAETDPLTGCLNRRSGLPAFEELLADSLAHKRHVAVLMIDLDNFKQINDLNGHQMGDLVLQMIAARISENMPEDSIVVRIGGDEFACALAYDGDDNERVDVIVDALIHSVCAPFVHDAMSVETTVSIGIASSRVVANSLETIGEVQPSTAETLVHRADMAMYHAKKRGRNRFYWFESSMENELRFRNELESGIRRGIPAGEFIPFYEQQIDLETGELVGFEMLARWNSQQYGLVSPEIFIPIAEEIDLISELSEALIRQAFYDAQAWDPALTLSVNISPLQMRDPWFAQKLLHLLVETGFPATRLEIEITESSLHENVGAVRSIITSLKNQGIKISLDDFGTGYSSLAQLRALPFDRLKIDRSFVAELTSGGKGSELVEAIVSLGKGLSLPVTAEGVENEEVLGVLRGMGQLKGQGYLYGRPEDAATTGELLQSLDLLAKRNDPLARKLPAPAAESFPHADLPISREAG